MKELVFQATLIKIVKFNEIDDKYKPFAFASANHQGVSVETNPLAAIFQVEGTSSVQVVFLKDLRGKEALEFTEKYLEKIQLQLDESAQKTLKELA